jgi:hypothetical protein
MVGLGLLPNVLWRLFAFVIYRLHQPFGITSFMLLSKKVRRGTFRKEVFHWLSVVEGDIHVCQGDGQHQRLARTIGEAEGEVKLPGIV